MESKTKPILITLLIATTITSGWLLVKNNSDKIEAAKERSVYAAEKELLNKEVNEIALEKKKVSDVSSLRKAKIDSLIKILDLKNHEIQRLIADNSKARDLRRKLADLEQTRIELRKEVTYLKQNESNMNLASSGLEAELMELKAQNEKLYAELLIAKSLDTNNMLVRNVKRNQKITSFASRTKVISLSFDYPNDQIGSLDVSIKTPDGKTYNSTNRELVSIVPSKEPVTETTGVALKRMEITLKPEKKFAKGIYKFTILRGADAINTIQVLLK